MKIHGIRNIQTENETDGTVSLWDTVHEVWVDRHSSTRWSPVLYWRTHAERNKFCSTQM